MQRKPLFLAAAVAEIVRFFLLGVAAEAAALLGVGRLAADFYRYAAAPQLLFGAAFFFLWLDGSRYAAYRPLALAGKALSLATFAAFAGSLLSSFGGEGLLPLPGTAFAAALGILVLDLAGLALLLFYAREPRPAGLEAPGLAAPPGGLGASRAARLSRPAPNAGYGPHLAPDPHAASGPRGPEDIEQVEV